LLAINLEGIMKKNSQLWQFRSCSDTACPRARSSRTTITATASGLFIDRDVTPSRCWRRRDEPEGIITPPGERR